MLLEKHILPGTHRGVGPGDGDVADSSLGSSQAGAGLRDRLHNLANHRETVRAMLGHSDWHYELQTIVDNVSLMRPELLADDWLESGHAVARKKPGGRLRGRWRPTHYPTDLGLLWDGVRCLIRETAQRRRTGWEAGGNTGIWASG